MRVAMISPLAESVPPQLYGGTERVIDNLCRGFRAAGIDVTLFAPGDSRTPADLVPIVPESLRLAQTPVADPVPYYLKMLNEVARRAVEFDVIHNHHDYWMLPLSEMTETPVVTTLHGRLDLPHIAAAFQAYPKMNYISISNRQRLSMSKLRWLRTIYHGMDLGKFRFRDRPGKYLAFLGRMDPTKGVHWAIEIAKRSGIPLKMAAKIDGREMEDYFEAQVKPHIDGKFIEYVGEIAEHEKSDFLGNAYALAFPIDWPEPFGLVVVEAMACGTPVLARPHGAMPELLRDGVTGFMHEDIGVLSLKTAEIPKVSRFGCRRWVEERFSLERMTEEHIDAYRSLIRIRWEDRGRRNAWDSGNSRNRGGIRPASATA
jgi:glycosyltransferase involved in cell wall biosynthesis